MPVTDAGRGDSMSQVKNRKTTLKRMWKYGKKYKVYLFFVFFCSIFGNLLLIFAPLLTGKAIDSMRSAGKVDFPVLINLIITLLILYMLSSLFQWLMSIFSNIAANRTIHDLRKDAFHKLNTLPIRYFDNTPHGDVISRMTNDLDAVSEGLFQGVTQIMSAIVIITGCFVFMLSISPFITLAVIIITPFCFLLASFIAKHSKKMFAEQSKTVGELNGYVEELIGNQKIVKAFGYEKHSFQQFQEINQRLYDCGQKAQWYSSLPNPTTRLVNNIAYVAVTVLGAWLTIRGNFTVGKIASFITYSNQFAKPINEVTSLTTQIQAAMASADRIFVFLDEQSEPEETKDCKELIGLRGEVRFEEVDFSYKSEIPLIKNFHLTVSPGDTIAIVGPTGSGKTTLVNLLMRFYDVNVGHIMVDGDNIYQVSKKSLRRNIGMVLQESWLFAGTIAENIAYGKPNATREAITRASREANADGFIRRMKHGYDTILEEDGGNLSQGQRQLLTIARVILMNPPMLILDEATSSIDTRTELKIQQALKTMMQGRTSFVIAHRLSTIKEADTILVLKDGNIIEQGSHNQLLNEKGFYYNLFQSQFADTSEKT